MRAGLCERMVVRSDLVTLEAMILVIIGVTSGAVGSHINRRIRVEMLDWNLSEGEWCECSCGGGPKEDGVPNCCSLGGGVLEL
jgi:hypothetical protein